MKQIKKKIEDWVEVAFFISIFYSGTISYQNSSWVAGTSWGKRERKRRRKRELPARLLLGHAVKSRMTVINRWRAIIFRQGRYSRQWDFVRI